MRYRYNRKTSLLPIVTSSYHSSCRLTNCQWLYMNMSIRFRVIVWDYPWIHGSIYVIYVTIERSFQVLASSHIHCWSFLSIPFIFCWLLSSWEGHPTTIISNPNLTRLPAGCSIQNSMARWSYPPNWTSGWEKVSEWYSVSSQSISIEYYTMMSRFAWC